jgi:hypothetical protein
MRVAGGASSGGIQRFAYSGAPIRRPILATGRCWAVSTDVPTTPNFEHVIPSAFAGLFELGGALGRKIPDQASELAGSGMTCQRILRDGIHSGQPKVEDATEAPV